MWECGEIFSGHLAMRVSLMWYVDMFIPDSVEMFRLLIPFVHCVPTLLDTGENMVANTDFILPRKPTFKNITTCFCKVEAFS